MPRIVPKRVVLEITQSGWSKTVYDQHDNVAARLDMVASDYGRWRGVGRHDDFDAAVNRLDNDDNDLLNAVDELDGAAVSRVLADIHGYQRDDTVVSEKVHVLNELVAELEAGVLTNAGGQHVGVVGLHPDFTSSRGYRDALDWLKIRALREKENT